MLLLLLGFVLQLQLKVLWGLILETAGGSWRAGVGPGTWHSVVAESVMLKGMRLIGISVARWGVGVEIGAVRIRIMVLIE